MRPSRQNSDRTSLLKCWIPQQFRQWSYFHSPAHKKASTPQILFFSSLDLSFFAHNFLSSFYVESICFDFFKSLTRTYAYPITAEIIAVKIKQLTP